MTEFFTNIKGPKLKLIFISKSFVPIELLLKIIKIRSISFALFFFLEKSYLFRQKKIVSF